MHANVNPGEQLHIAFFGMLIFFPSRLNEEGKRARKMVLISCLGLAITAGLILFLMWLNGTLDPKPFPPN
jgi:hypothetical protein